ncbi:MAG: hypothetical protein A7316_05830 [Candidatus Altiarchaeales archaeon WOR_SM1_86-2]|nr:MAG: hypothetical protein A7316_05830 [Candidatus Altiarchaeales archaeon WOR_SM1_86-2]
MEKETGKGIPNLRVKAIDKDLFFDDILGTVATDKNGNFEIKYDKEDFRELFFDKKPDIYLKIKNPGGEVIHTTEDKVRYEAGRTEKFNIKISKNEIKKQKMKWDIKKSDELKERIAKDEKLMRKLSNSADKVLKKHGVELKGMSYVFEPRVFTMSPKEAPEVMVKARKAMAIAIIEDSYRHGDPAPWKTAKITMKCLPQCGPLDRFTLDVLEKFRISEVAGPDPTPWHPSEILIKQIVGNKELLGELSESIFGILEENGIKFEKNEGCVFTPCVFETPIFAQKVAAAERSEQIRGFGPQVYADPHPDPWLTAGIKLRPLPGIIFGPWGPTPGIIIDRWWWIGIPAPEMLHALDVMREYG